MSRQPAQRVLVSSLLLLVAVAAADLASGSLYSFSIFYLFVVVRPSATGRDGYLMPTALVTALTWSIVEAQALRLAEPLLPLLWNSAARFGVLWFTGLLVASVVETARAEREVSRTDPLTQLRNRRGFYDTAEAEVARAGRGPRPVSVVFLDLDGFKGVNDARGHATGDRLLSEVAATLAAHLRRYDVVARLGGDEFVALLPETDAATARTVVARVAQALEALSAAGDWPVGFSLGVATFLEAPGTVDELLSEADRLMYQAKRDGHATGTAAIVARTAAGRGAADVG